MARIRSMTGETVTAVDDGWHLCVVPAGAALAPSDLSPELVWIPAGRFRTTAAALQAAGIWSLAAPEPLHDKDVWWQAPLEARGAFELRFHGLATLATVWLDGVELLQSSNMYQAFRIPVTLAGRHRLTIRFAALTGALAAPARRARWRPALVDPPSLRTIRTTLLGHMPGWCPPVHLVGPWRGVDLVACTGLSITNLDVHTAFDGRDGTIRLRLEGTGALPEGHATVVCGGSEASLFASGDGLYEGDLHLPGIEPWWPHTHGVPRLHPLELRLGARRIELDPVGFRHLQFDGLDGSGRVSLAVNGTKIFCRGACWTPSNLVEMSTGAASFLQLERAATIGMNMLRIGGTMVYEDTQFYSRCDELGLLVWQDFMFANFDYPVSDSLFLASVQTEVKQFLDRVQTSPCLAVLCGGSEMSQQAAMLGLPKKSWRSDLTSDVLPGLAAQLRPDVPYVENSPSGGSLPFAVDSGVAHYYGVGAYMRPLDDARRANVCFASECLAFANVPESEALEANMANGEPAHVAWKKAVPRDRGAGWDFDDVRDHYLTVLYGLDPARLRYEDPDRYADFSRAVSAEVIEATFAEWRRDGSTTSGGLVWFYQDLAPGAGWGIVDSRGEPKAACYGLQRASRPVQVVMTDEGVNGLRVHLINERPTAQVVTVKLECLRDGRTPVVSGEETVTLSPRETVSRAASDLLGAFFDTTYAYRFGPSAHDVSVARLFGATDGRLIADAFHFPNGRKHERHTLQIKTELRKKDEIWWLDLETDRLAQSIQIRDRVFRAQENWFHLAPGQKRSVRLEPRMPTSASPHGEIRALNMTMPLSYGSPT